MKFLFTFATTFSLLLTSCLAFSHGDDDHAHTIQSVEARRIALQTAKTFVTTDPNLGFGKLAASWNDLKMSKTKLHEDGDGYFIVTVNNEAELKTLYVLISKTGDVYDANFEGTFPDLNK